VTGNIVSRPRKVAGWWTPERRQVAWDMYVAGKSFEEIAEHFGVTLAAAARQVYQHKKEQMK